MQRRSSRAACPVTASSTLLRETTAQSAGHATGLRRHITSGADPALDPSVSPENDPALQGGTRVNGFGALNFQVPSGPLAGHRLALEMGAPVYESLNGPQSSADWTLNVGWEYSF